MRAIKKDDLNNIMFYQCPKWLFDLLLEGELTPGAFSTYILMYERTRISLKNKWIDKNGEVYIKYSYEELLEDLKVKSNTQIQRNLRKLEELHLLDKKKNFSSSTTYYLNIYSPTQNESTSPTQNESTSPTQNESTSPTQNVETSNNNFSNNNIKKNNTSSKDDEKGFEEFWNLYNKKRGKVKTLGYWKKKHFTDEQLKEVLEKVKVYVANTEKQ